ncbi:uroporphyrinogen decarboxylase [Flindersiella endophytica]
MSTVNDEREIDLATDEPETSGEQPAGADAEARVSPEPVAVSHEPLSTSDDEPSRVSESAFLAACLGKPVPHIPVWFMRQAGRSLPEYRKLRDGVPMLDSCTRPELVVEITLQPVRRYGVDAAIFYSDIMVPLKAIGVNLDIVPGVGPVVAEPVSEESDLAQLRPLEPSDVPYVSESVDQLVKMLEGTPLIGFAGGPFTMASYLVEGGPSRDHVKTKALMFNQPKLWHALAGRLADIASAFLRVQVEAGASAVQLFDSWAGALSPADYETFVAPHSRAILSSIGELNVPRIHFGVGTGELLRPMADVGADVVGVDWRVPLSEAVRRTGGRPVQGNLDPSLVLAPWKVLAEKARAVIAEGRSAPGHIFNLGHGVMPQTDPDVLARLVDLVHTESPTL